MKKPWIAAVLNFFFMGAGYIYNGKRLVLGILFTLGALGLTYVEFQIKEIDTQLYFAMFISVLIVNTAFSVDGYNEAKQIRK